MLTHAHKGVHFKVIHVYYWCVFFFCKCVLQLFDIQGRCMQNIAPWVPEGTCLTACLWIMKAVLAWYCITVPAGCPPLCKAALWTHGTWPLCCGSCSRQILCRSAHESRPALHGNCKHIEPLLTVHSPSHHCSSMTITSVAGLTSCKAQQTSCHVMYGSVQTTPYPLKLCNSIFSPRNSRNSTKAGLSSLLPNSSSSDVCIQQKQS